MTSPGWYSEPGDPNTERYWDGEQWTPQMRPLGQATEAPSMVLPAPVVPEPPREARKPRRWLIPAIGAVVAVIAAAVIIPLAVRGGDSSGGQIPYGMDPVHLATKLNICDEPQRYKSVATCQFDGHVIGIASVKSKESQSFAGALAQDSDTACALIGHGYDIQAPDLDTLYADVEVDAIQKRYGGALFGGNC